MKLRTALTEPSWFDKLTMKASEASSVRLSRRIGDLAAGGGAETLDPGSDDFRAGLERRTVDDEARRDVGDALDLLQPVLLQGAAAGDEVDDAVAEAQGGGQLHRAVELDAFGLHATRREMPL